MKAPFQKERRKLDLERLEDWPKKLREEKEAGLEKAVDSCPYCSGKNIVKRGKRKKKLESIQLYLCNGCNKTFTPQKVKGKKFPLKVIIDGLSYYNLGYTQEESCALLKEHYGFDVAPLTLSNWLGEFSKLCTYSRMREHGKKLFTPNQIIQSTVLYHRQVYKFRYHKAKAALMLQDFRHEKFEPLRQFLEAVSAECPHQFFQEGLRSSEVNAKFDLSQVRISEKNNFAVRLAQLVLQAVNNNRERHEILQKFMLANDSVTVACEVPVWFDNEDLEHMQSLGFDIPPLFSGIGSKSHAGIAGKSGDSESQVQTLQYQEGQDTKARTTPGLRRVMTGHIDILQIRNGSVHILDYKPDARHEKPIEQLMIYALALSRLTGLRLFELKCAWFDDKNYYEFFPLHIVYKKKKMRIPKDQSRLDTEENPVIAQAQQGQNSAQGNTGIGTGD